MIPVVIPVSIPGLDSLVAELSGVKIVLESLDDCMCFSDEARSRFSLNSSCVLLFKPDFKAKPVLVVALLEELLVSLGSDASEMLEISI